MDGYYSISPSHIPDPFIPFQPARQMAVNTKEKKKRKPKARRKGEETKEEILERIQKGKKLREGMDSVM